MTALIVGASLMLAHITGAIALVAPALGNIGTVITTSDKVVADTVNIRNYVVAKKAAHKTAVSK